MRLVRCGRIASVVVMDWLARSAAETPEAPALVFEDRTFTYAEMDGAADAAASILGATPRLASGAVALWGERDPATVAALWGIPRHGAMAVPVDPGLPPADSMDLTRRAGVRALWAIPDRGIDGLLARRAPPANGWGPGHPDSRFLIHTSGSEGAAKGVILTGENIAAAAEASRLRLGNGPADTWLAVLPLFHVGGLAILWRQAEVGGTVVLHHRFDADAAAAALGDGSVTLASLVPTMLRRILDRGVKPSTRLRAVLVGGGFASQDLIRRAREAGYPVLPTYGMTETGGQVATVAPDEQVGAPGGVGRPLDGFEVRISGEGRIEVRGAAVSSGYLGEKPREPGSWFTTGDLGEIDAEGRLTVRGRADNVLVTGGENVSPEVVASVIAGHPGVVAAHALGEPDLEWGTRLVVEVVLQGADVDDVRDWAASRLSRPAMPREWRVVDRLSEKAF